MNYFTSLKLTILIIVTFCIPTKSQIIPSSADLSYLISSNSAIHLDHKIISKNKAFWVILEVSTNEGASIDSIKYSYSFANKLDDTLNNFIDVNLNDYVLQETVTKKTFAFELATTTAPFLVFRIFYLATKSNYTYIINLEKSTNFFFSKTDLTIPILNGFSSKNKQIKISTLEGTTKDFGVQFYAVEYSAALPPMANLKNSNPFGTADTSFVISANTVFPVLGEGVYQVFENENEKNISSFRIASKTYPQLSSIKELIDASIYLFTKKEKEKLSVSVSQKKDYDAFWLENTNSSERAGNTISAYFSRVREANAMFTTYKEGWKTDMGMIYIIFGTPDKVFRSDKSIQWIYKKTYEMPSLLFTYYLNSDKSDKEYFELDRDINYQNTWFRAVDLWRKGRKNL